MATPPVVAALPAKSSGKSSLRMTVEAEPVLIEAPVGGGEGSAITTEKASSDSTVMSPWMATTMVLASSLAAKLKTPEGSTPPKKSPALAWLEVTCQLTVARSEVSPVRATVKMALARRPVKPSFSAAALALTG